MPQTPNPFPPPAQPYNYLTIGRQRADGDVDVYACLSCPEHVPGINYLRLVRTVCRELDCNYITERQDTSDVIIPFDEERNLIEDFFPVHHGVDDAIFVTNVTPAFTIPVAPLTTGWNEITAPWETTNAPNFGLPEPHLTPDNPSNVPNRPL